MYKLYWHVPLQYHSFGMKCILIDRKEVSVILYRTLWKLIWNSYLNCLVWYKKRTNVLRGSKISNNWDTDPNSKYDKFVASWKSLSIEHLFLSFHTHGIRYMFKWLFPVTAQHPIPLINEYLLSYFIFQIVGWTYSYVLNIMVVSSLLSSFTIRCNGYNKNARIITKNLYRHDIQWMI